PARRREMQFHVAEPALPAQHEPRASEVRPALPPADPGELDRHRLGVLRQEPFAPEPLPLPEIVKVPFGVERLGMGNRSLRCPLHTSLPRLLRECPSAVTDGVFPESAIRNYSGTGSWSRRSGRSSGPDSCT